MRRAKQSRNAARPFHRKGGLTSDPVTRGVKRQARLNRARALRPKFRADREEEP